MPWQMGVGNQRTFVSKAEQPPVTCARNSGASAIIRIARASWSDAAGRTGEACDSACSGHASRLLLCDAPIASRERDDGRRLRGQARGGKRGDWEGSIRPEDPRAQGTLRPDALSLTARVRSAAHNRAGAISFRRTQCGARRSRWSNASVSARGGRIRRGV